LNKYRVPPATPAALSFCMSLDWPPFYALLIWVLAIVAAYAVFGLVGFGTALVSAPLLSAVLPMATIVPFLALLDFVAASANVTRIRRLVVWREVLGLFPLMLLGSMGGAYMLLRIPQRSMAALLGLFVVAYAIGGLYGRISTRSLSGKWALFIGPAGGLLSAMFGSGGFVYSIYLTRRIGDPDCIRATQNAMTCLATTTRVAIFAASGVYDDLHIVVLATLALPGALLGLYTGHRIARKLDREQFLRVMFAVLALAGTSLIVKAFI